MESPSTETGGQESPQSSGAQQVMRHLLFSAVYEGPVIAPSSVLSGLRDVLESRGAEPIEGKAWTSPQFMHPEAGSLWAAWWALHDSERMMIQERFPRLFTALYLLLAPLEKREQWLLDGLKQLSSEPIDPGDVKAFERILHTLNQGHGEQELRQYYEASNGVIAEVR
jgi:hypothetical protein